MIKLLIHSVACFTLFFASASVAENLRIIGEDKAFVATLPSGEAITITRQMTPCAKNRQQDSALH